VNDVYENQVPSPDAQDRQLNQPAAPGPGYQQQPTAPVAPLPAQSVPAFAADKKDGVFALFAYILGYLFCRWTLSAVQGWGTAVFTTVFLAAVLAYLLAKGIRLRKESWFWLAVTLLAGWSFALWDDIGLSPLRNMFLFCAAVYWVLTATGTLVGGRTGNYLLLDGLNAVFVIPFRNFINQYRAFGALKSGREKNGKKTLSVLLGIVLALIVLLIVTPQLLRADSGGFSNLIESFLNLFHFDWPRILEFLFYALLAVPTAAYLFGLVSGAAAKRGTNTFSAEKAGNTARSLRVLAPVTVNTVLGAVTIVYVLFIVCQLPYFFSAFAGSRPEGWLSYSEYARQGFFELVSIAAINLALLAGANIFSKKPRPENLALRVFNIVLALITLLLIATAMSKMALYIDTFGLTMLRILPCVFMVLLGVVCVAVIVLQKVKFSVARVALVTSAVLFTALCLADADAYIVRYNTDRFLAGTLSSYDIGVLSRSGSAGVLPAIEVYQSAADPVLKAQIKAYLTSEKVNIEFYNGTFRDTLQNSQAWEKLKDLNLGAPCESEK
jgi:hypothetical protein